VLREDDEEQDQRLAADPSTPPETLRELLRRSPSLAALVARNPGAPTDLLLGFPYEWIAAHLLQNPVFPLCLLEDPTLHRATPSLRQGLARHPETPVELLAAFLDSDDLLIPLALAQNPALPADLQRRLALSSSEYARVTLARTHPIPETFHALLLSDASQQVRHWASQTIGRCKLCRPWRSLLRHAHALAYRGHPRRPLSFRQQQELLAGGVWARVLLAQQPTLSRQIRWALEQDGAPQVKKALDRGIPEGARDLQPGGHRGSLRHEARCRQKDALRKGERSLRKAARGAAEEDEER
jgi:hypothetical protein